MSMLMLFNKPYRVLCQFSSDGSDKTNLSQFIRQPNLYPAGRLDYDSEGLLLLIGDGTLQHKISHPKFKKEKTYLVQVDGEVSISALKQLGTGIDLNDGKTRPAKAQQIDEPTWLWTRTPPVRFRKHIPTTWLELTITEGRNRQVRRMTAAVGNPTLRLIRTRIDQWELGSLLPGEHRLT